MGVLYLVRHGQAPAHAYAAEPVAADAPGLTELGFAQARRTGLELARQVPEFTATVSGALPRQQATLTAAMEAFAGGPDPLIDPGWDEYAIPALPGAPTTEMYTNPAAYQQMLDAALARWTAGAEHDGESYADYIARMNAAAERAVDLAGSGQTVLVVSSAGTITALLARLWGVPPEQWPIMARAMVNASITKLLVGRRGLTVVSMNEHGHLSAREVGLATFR